MTQVHWVYLYAKIWLESDDGGFVQSVHWRQNFILRRLIMFRRNIFLTLYLRGPKPGGPHTLSCKLYMEPCYLSKLLAKMIVRQHQNQSWTEVELWPEQWVIGACKSHVTQGVWSSIASVFQTVLNLQQDEMLSVINQWANKAHTWNSF